MQGRVFGFGDLNSNPSYLIPSIEIPTYKEGIMTDSGAYFDEVKFTDGHEQTIVAVNNGDIDGGAFLGTLSSLLSTRGLALWPALISLLFRRISDICRAIPKAPRPTGSRWPKPQAKQRSLTSKTAISCALVPQRSNM